MSQPPAPAQRIEMAELPPASPERRWPWPLVALLGFAAGALLLGLVATQSGLFGGEDLDAALDDAYTRGYEAGLLRSADRGPSSAVRLEAAYLRGVRAAAGAGRIDTRSTVLPVNPMLVFPVQLARLDRELLGTCPKEVPEWLFTIAGVAGCETNSPAAN